MVPVGLSVDLGTSHTVAVLLGRDGDVNPLLFDGSPLLVSAVFAGADGALAVGRDAMHSARLAPERFEPHPKRRIDDGSVLLGDVEVSVQDMFTAILTRVRDECVRVTGIVPAVTLTHPATWGPVRRQILIDAADAAGIPTPQLMPEPVAAASYFTRRRPTDIPVGSVIVVYDLGGGTFDITVVQRNDSGFEVLAADGASDLGGVDVDHALVAHLGESHQDDPQWSYLMNPQSPDHRRQRRHFLDDVRSAKERLSRDNHVDLLIPLVEREVHLTRIELEKLARPLLDKTVRLTQTLIRATGRDQADITGIFLVGGASRMPLAATLLHRATGIAPTAIDQPETVVANGALPGDRKTNEPPPHSTPPPGDPAKDNERGVKAEQRGDLDEAEIWYLRAAEAGEVVAMRNLGFLLRDREDLAGAEKWFRRAAEAGHALAMNSLGLLLNDRGQVAEAEAWYRRAADAGVALAMNNLGSLFQHHHGDFANAEICYREAADAGEAIAMRNLACLLRDREDPAEAEGWFRKAADAGHAPAMNDLGILLENQGDAVKADEWYRKAAEAGSVLAMRNLACLLRDREDPAEAEGWFRKAADAGHAPAMNDLGLLLKERGEPVDAEAWFRQAADGGDGHAMHNLGLLIEDQGDPVEAEVWFRRAAGAGNVAAMNLLANNLVERDDFTEAETWLQAAAETGDPTAMLLLGTLPMRQLDLENLSTSSMEDLVAVDRVLAEARPWLTRTMEHADGLAEAEHDLALSLLAMCHLIPALRGEPSEVELWLPQAAELGDGSAMTFLGVLAEHHGDLAEAETWWRRAAASKDDGAMKRLGALLENREQLDEAEIWYRRAADSADQEGMSSLGDLMEKRGDLIQAEYWWRRAADVDDASAMTKLGDLLEARGESAESENWYRKSISTIETGINAIPETWLVNDSVVKEWVRDSVTLGEKAMTGLGHLLENRGEHSEAQDWHRKAADYASKSSA